MFDAQGEDVVAGTHQTEPIRVLETRLPDVATELRDHATRLERHYADLCDIEFTIEDARLWMLQVRVGKRSPQAALRIAVDMAEDPAFPLTRAEAVERVRAILADPPRTTTTTDHGDRPAPIATGLPASPGAGKRTARDGSGRGGRGCRIGHARDPGSCRDLARRCPRDGRCGRGPDLAWWPRQSCRGRRAWLGDPGGGRGGRASRSATGRSSSAIGRCEPGDRLTIDGSTGEVFDGVIESTTEIVPEAATLLEWATEAGISIGEPAAAPDARSGPRRHREPRNNREPREPRRRAHRHLPQGRRHHPGPRRRAGHDR